MPSNLIKSQKGKKLVVKVNGKSNFLPILAAAENMSENVGGVQVWQEGRGRGTTYIVKNHIIPDEFGPALIRLVESGIPPESCTWSAVEAEVHKHRVEKLQRRRFPVDSFQILLQSEA